MTEWKRPAIVARLSFPDPRLSCYPFEYAIQAAATADCAEERMLKLHGTSMSSAGRCLWALEELGLEYEHIPTAIADTRTPAHLKLNPNGHIPVLEDDRLVLFESIAINLYLADKYGRRDSLWPASVEDRGRAYQWSFWAVTEIEPYLIVMIRHEMFTPPEECDLRAIEGASEALKAPLKVLDDHLKGRDYILGNKFTIAES